jgi:hypothetical protein
VLAEIGGGPVSLLGILLLGVLGAVLWGREHPPQEVAKARDVPDRLLQWVVGLLPADRIEWGQAMLGELDRVTGFSARWRFALSCVAGVLLPPPQGAVGPMAVLGTFALGSAIVFGIGFVHFGLATSPGNWVELAILAAIVMATLIGVSVQLRRPAVARLGLIGGFVVAAVWLGISNFTYLGIISPITSVGSWSGPLLIIGVPLVVGMGATWRSGSASVGRRATRLAGISGGLAMFFIATIAVVAIDGGPRDPGASVADGVSEAFFSAAFLFLISMPLAMTAVGWVAATSTGRLRSLVLSRRIHLASVPIGAGAGTGESQSRNVRPALIRVAAVLVILAALALFVLIR